MDSFEETCRAEFDKQCARYKRAHLPGSKATAVERAYDQVDLYLTWLEMKPADA